MRLFKNVDLHAELDKLADRGEQERLLNEALGVLNHDIKEERKLQANLNRPQSSLHNIDGSSLDPSRIYDLEHIRSLSVRFRLRFLNSDLFKSDVPKEALFEMRRLQLELKMPLSGFKILAPSKLFKLKDCNEDPLLFLTLPNNQFYLIHKWGNDLAWYRELAFLPFRSLHTLFPCVFLIALSIGLAFPESWFNGMPADQIPAMRGFLTMYSLIALSGMSVLFAFIFSKNFNSKIWNSRFFN